MRRALFLLVLPLLAGCIDFVEVQGPAAPANDPARIFVSVAVVPAEPGTGASDSLTIYGLVYTGRDGAGRVRDVADRRLVVDGSPVPERPDPRGYLTFAQTRPLHAARPASWVLTVEPPRIAGLASRTVRLPVTRRAGPDTLSIAAGAGLTLPLLTPTAPTDMSELRWNLTVFEAGAHHVSIMGSGRVPEPLVVPAHLLPRDTAGGTPPLLHAALDVGRSLRWTDTSALEVDVALHTQLRWQVRVRSAAP